MKVISLDGEEYTINFGRYIKEKSNPSNLHLRVRDFIHKQYPASPVCEEVYIPSEQIYIDFFIPVIKTVIEADGEQHIKYNSFFFNNKMDWMRAKARDKKKVEFCIYNNWKFRRFYDNETDEEWITKLNKMY